MTTHDAPTAAASTAKGRRRSARALLAIVIVAILGGLGWVATTAASGSSSKRIELTGQVTGSSAGDAHTMGDVLVFTDSLFDSDGEQVALSVAEAVVTSETLTFDPVEGDMLCTITLTFDDGQISLVGAADIATIFSGEAYSVPIVGGSGRYRTARGEAIYRNFDPATGTYDLTLRWR